MTLILMTIEIGIAMAVSIWFIPFVAMRTAQAAGYGWMKGQLLFMVHTEKGLQRGKQER